MFMQNNKTPEELRQALQELKTQYPRLYPRDLAAKLGVSEAQLIALGAGKTAFKLTVPDVLPLLNGLGQFGEPLFIVRNDDAVLEREVALKFEDKEHSFSGANASGDVRLMFSKTGIASIFAVHAEKFVKRGLQFFDASGTAILKTYVRDESKCDDFDAWVRPWISTDQSDALKVAAPEAPCGAQHAHDPATCGCGHGSTASAVELPPESFKTLLKAAAKSGEPVALALANRFAFFRVGAPSVKKVAPMEPWFNILDDTLHSHLREEAVSGAKAWGNKEKNELRLASLSAQGKVLFWLRVALDGAAAKETLAAGGAQ
jgi:putative hemin transport protein